MHLSGLTMDEVTAQAIIFLIAGYETTATTLGFLIYNLTVHPECQDKVLKEIDEVFANKVQQNDM